MNYNKEPCSPVYTRQQAISSLKAYNLAFKRTAQCNNNNNNNNNSNNNNKKTPYDLEPEEEQTAYYAHSAR